ncbi:MAG: PilZ domain-containing protein [OCS116 cluster bacterium]|nr:PilZ domain-containing protein [OCS116 cluster bacterium]
MTNDIGFGKRQKIQPIAAPIPVPQAPQYTGPDRRAGARRKMLKGCKIIFNNHFSVFDGVIVNISETGARIKATNPAYVANEFLLTTVFGNQQYTCNVMWRDKEFIGVQFDTM